jgi:hypothetical protein
MSLLERIKGEPDQFVAAHQLNFVLPNTLKLTLAAQKRIASRQGAELAIS